MDEGVERSEGYVSALQEIWLVKASAGRKLKLVGLELTSSDLDALMPDIEGIEGLEGLFLGGNKLTTFPEGILQLSDLKILDLSNNNLRTVPDEINCLYRTLEVLDVKNNQLRELPDGFWELDCLKILDVKGNELLHLSNTIGNLRNLQSLNVSDNNLHYLPPSIVNFSSGFELDISNNPHLQVTPDLEEHMEYNFNVVTSPGHLNERTLDYSFFQMMSPPEERLSAASGHESEVRSRSRQQSPYGPRF